MDWVAFVNQIIVILGIPTIIGSAILLGRKLEILDRVQKSIDDEIRPDLKDLRDRFNSRWIKMK